MMTMPDSETPNPQLQADLLRAKVLVAAQREEITALGGLVSEMTQTIARYEDLLKEAAETIRQSKRTIDLPDNPKAGG